MKKIKFFKYSLFILSGLLLFDSLANVNNSHYIVYAEDNETYTYVEDIVGFAPYLDGFNWAKVEEYKSKGYKHVDGNFNKDTGYDRSEVYLMYKPTNDESKALRKVSTMEMDGGYSTWDYSSMIEGYDENINHSIVEFKDATKYYNIHYNLKETTSIASNGLLDFYYYPKNTKDISGESLGSFLLSERTDEEYKRILLYSNATILGNIVTAILLSGTEIGPTLWMDRFVEELKNPICTNTEEEEDTPYVDLKNYYGESLNVVSSNINEYVTALDAAKARHANYGFSDSGEDLTSIDDYIDEQVEKYNEPCEENDEDFSLIEYDSILSLYKVNNVGGKSVNKTLSDIIHEMGEGDLESTYGYMYAFVKSLNPAQFFGIKNAGFSPLMLYTGLSLSTDEANLTIEEKEIYHQYGTTSSILTQLEKTKANFVSVLGTHCISIYAGTNSDLLDRSCAITSNALRNNSALNEIDNLTADDALQEDLLKALTYIQYGASICGSISMISYSLGAFLCPDLGFFALIKQGFKALKVASLRTVKVIIGSTVGAGGLAGLAVCICCAVIIGIILLVKKVINHMNETKEDYSPIPETIIDCSTVNGENVYSRYDVVRNIMDDTPFNMNYKRTVYMKRGSIINHNAIYASRWQALYFTKDKRIGSPLIEKDGIFMGHTNSDSHKIFPEMYPICKFGNFSQANLNGYKTYEKCLPSYAAYYTKGKVSDPIYKNGKYIESVILRCDKSSEATKEQINNEGYLLLDRNLSPNNEYATYIGYRTTDNSDQAVRDIRLAWNEASETIIWGDTSNTYGFGGSGLNDVSNKGENKNHICLYYTKMSGLGSPILSHVNTDESSLPDGFGVVPHVKDIPEGCEGINFFSGGTAFDFNFYNKLQKQSWDNTKVFLYFKPEIQFTSKNSVAYVSGLGAFGGSSVGSYSFNDFVTTQTGFMADTIASTGESFEQIAPDMNITGPLLYASYTYNPYRAIYDIATQVGQENNPYLPSNLIANNQGYFAVTIYCQGDQSYYDKSKTKDTWRVIRDSHTITNNHNTSLDEGATLVKSYVICPRAMYCSGPTSGRSPILANTIHCYNKKGDIPESRPLWCSAHELKNHYYNEEVNGLAQEKAYNFACFRPDQPEGAYGFYLFYESTIRVRPKYVKDVFTYESTAEKSAYNDTIFNLLNMGVDDIFEKYTISKLNKRGEDFSKQVFFHLTSGQTIWRNCNESDVWTQKSGMNKHKDALGFFGVSYTNKKNEAIGSIKIYCQTIDEFNRNGSQKPDNIMNMKNDVSGKLISYTRATDFITSADNMYMWLYTSKSGNKITDVNLSNSFKYGISDAQINSQEFKVNSHLVTDQTLSNYRAPNFCLSYVIEEPSYIKEVVYYYTNKDNFENTLLLARLLGCTDFKVFDVENNVYLVLGLVRTSSRSEAIKDLRMTLGSSYETNIGGKEYILAEKIDSPYSYPFNFPLIISYTKGTKEDNKYALTDITFYTSGENLLPDGQTATFDENLPESVYDFDSSSNGDIFEVTFNNGTYKFLMVRKDNSASWGVSGPNSATASIFSSNPSLMTVLILLGAVILLGGVGALIYYNEKKKHRANQ